MPERQQIEALKQALKPFTGRSVHYGALSVREQIIDDLCNSLHVQLDNLLDEIENGAPPADEADKRGAKGLEAVLHLLGGLAGAGVLEEALDPALLEILQKTLGDVSGASKTVQALRKMDKANALKSEADTDLFEDKENRIDEAVDKKKS